MFVVLIAGATVTNTGSAEGCGRDWPLCRGQFIPEFAITTAIEYVHRVITGIEGVLVLALTIGLLVLYRSRVAARVLAVLLMGSIVLQAGMGAWAVVQPQAPAVLALHFGISLIAFAAAVLAALAARWPERTLLAPPVGTGVRVATWAAGVYMYALIYTGAFVRHLGAAYACPSWPLCGPGGAPSWLVSINLAHRIGAGLALLVGLGLVLFYSRWTSGRWDLVTGGWLVVGSIVLQALAGAYLVASGWSLYGELTHAGVTALVFAAISYLCFRVTLGGAPRQAEGTARRLDPEPA
jgi:heme a synthase